MIHYQTLCDFMGRLGLGHLETRQKVRVLQDLGILKMDYGWYHVPADNTCILDNTCIPGTTRTKRGQIFFPRPDSPISILEFLVDFDHQSKVVLMNWAMALIGIALSTVDVSRKRDDLELAQKDLERLKVAREYDPELLHWSLLAGMPLPPPLKAFKESILPSQETPVASQGKYVRLKMLRCLALLKKWFPQT